ncbi:hypothetical protein J3U01_08725, partial [Bifidobacterium sp. B4107]|uniref:hypothetical protein n=1 Tax=unclassified Bifidobacterium TaxID=2608897 RepID=UPI00226B4033
AHHGNAPITDLEARTFHEELRSDATLADAMEAVKRFYAANDQGRWMLSGDVNAGIRAIRKTRMPENAQIERLMDRAGIDSDHALTYRRRLIKAIGEGRSLEQAHAIALEASQRLIIEAPKPKPKRRPVRHFIGHGQAKAGDMQIQDVIGGRGDQ